MKRAMLVAATGAALLIAPATASAQFGSLKSMIPSVPGGHGDSDIAGGGAVDPDRFLADTLETSKYIMTATAILADAASQAPDNAALAARIKSIQEVKDVKELDAHREEMAHDMDALAANKGLQAQLQANLGKCSAEQRKRIAAAAYNFSLGAYRNVRLSQEAPHVMDSIKSNPRLLMKAGELKTAAGLVLAEAKGMAGMTGSLHTIMTASKIDEPVQSEATKPQPIDNV